MRSKWNSLTRFLVSAVALSAASGLVRPAFPGTELGNARFVEYENTLHGFSIAYPEEWNVIDLGNAVNVVGAAQSNVNVMGGVQGRAEASREETAGESLQAHRPADAWEEAGQAFGEMASVEISFDLSHIFQTPIAFERHVRKAYPKVRWKPVAFRGRSAFEAMQYNRRVFAIMKDMNTLMLLSFPVDGATGLPPALIEKTVQSFEFRAP